MAVVRDPRTATRLREALAELTRAPDRPYYDEEVDRRTRDAYYAPVAGRADGRALYGALTDLLAATHTTELPYKPAVRVYPWVDLHPDLRLRSLYSGRTFDAAEFIRADAEIAERRLERARSRGLPIAGEDDGSPDDAPSALEEELPYNCEHVVPQSWFAKREPMRGDLHHLFACESGCNSFRGNTPYFEFPAAERVIRHACGRLEPGRFEPEHGKGPAARAVLYFILRYPTAVQDAPAELEATRLATLLAWHAAEPPTPYELHRNQAIHELQGNRNPLIDHPEWASTIAFAAGLG